MISQREVVSKDAKYVAIGVELSGEQWHVSAVLANTCALQLSSNTEPSRVACGLRCCDQA